MPQARPSQRSLCLARNVQKRRLTTLRFLSFLFPWGRNYPRDACMTSPPRQREDFLTSCEEGTQSERPFHLPIASKRCCVEASRCMSSRYF
jgi:hypothetical protein